MAYYWKCASQITQSIITISYENVPCHRTVINDTIPWISLFRLVQLFVQSHSTGDVELSLQPDEHTALRSLYFMGYFTDEDENIFGKRKYGVVIIFNLVPYHALPFQPPDTAPVLWFSPVHPRHTNFPYVPTRLRTSRCCSASQCLSQASPCSGHLLRQYCKPSALPGPSEERLCSLPI